MKKYIKYYTKYYFFIIFNMVKTLFGTSVEWDENKNSINKKKHGISFETAALVFADENRIEFFDKFHSTEEDRYIVLGCVHGILYVVYTMRGTSVRLIPARRTTTIERRIYYGE